ncbi:hypothetical protein EYF80_066264 [Liparis tanakae]|uniref:Uncharacterized protein n=1 Tax=Liparis tanakae TaxID=230148 RepID=A0A4Z2E4S6_9TELE|nr:hypothetical protein EYF80_066264 [Liparis tanakae]
MLQSVSSVCRLATLELSMRCCRSAVLPPFFFWSSFMSLRFRISASLFTA